MATSTAWPKKVNSLSVCRRDSKRRKVFAKRSVTQKEGKKQKLAWLKRKESFSKKLRDSKRRKVFAERSVTQKEGKKKKLAWLKSKNRVTQMVTVQNWGVEHGKLERCVMRKFVYLCTLVTRSNTRIAGQANTEGRKTDLDDTRITGPSKQTTQEDRPR